MMEIIIHLIYSLTNQQTIQQELYKTICHRMGKLFCTENRSLAMILWKSFSWCSSTALLSCAWFAPGHVLASANIDSRRDTVPATPELVVQRLGQVSKREDAKVDQIKMSLGDRHVRGSDFVPKA